jgi:hypothetical protein
MANVPTTGDTRDAYVIRAAEDLAAELLDPWEVAGCATVAEQLDAAKDAARFYIGLCDWVASRLPADGR